MIKKKILALCLISLVSTGCSAARRAPQPVRDDLYTCPAKCCALLALAAGTALWAGSIPLDHISAAERDLKHGIPVDDTRLSMLMADCDLHGDTSLPNKCSRDNPLSWQRYNALHAAYDREKMPFLILEPPVTPVEKAYVKAFNSALVNLYTLANRTIEACAELISASNSTHRPTLKNIQKLGTKILQRFEKLHSCARDTKRIPCQEAHAALLQSYLLKPMTDRTVYADGAVWATLYHILPVSNPDAPRDLELLYNSDNLKAVIAQIDCIDRSFQQIEKAVHEAMARAAQQLAVIPGNTTNQTLVDILEDGARKELAERRRHEQEAQKTALKRCYKNLYH